jgi:hypothetical protein
MEVASTMRRRIAVMVAMVMMVMMSAAPAMAHHDVAHFNNGNSKPDGPDKNRGGGNDEPKKAKANQGGGND